MTSNCEYCNKQYTCKSCNHQKEFHRNVDGFAGSCFVNKCNCERFIS